MITEKEGKGHKIAYYFETTFFVEDADERKKGLREIRAKVKEIFKQYPNVTIDRITIKE